VQRGLVALTRAWQLRNKGNAAYAQQLREGFAAAREYNLVQLLRPLPAIVAQLCADALARGIEREFLYKVIAARRLRPPPDAGAGWPWPIKIRTLGTFEVLLDDAPPAFGRKTQKKPLDLLKLIIAMGGRDVPADMLIDALWTSADDVGSLGALEMLTARLRKLLRHPDAVLVADRRISLNADLVWVDALALEPQLTHWLANASGASERSAQWLASYPGHFLPGDGDSPVLLARRDRLWSLASRYIERQGTELLRQQAYGEAAQLYRRAIELDLLAEGFYRNLMVCYRELGQRAEAIDVFRRLRQNLAVMLGIKPSAPTEAVCHTLQQQP
jgi:DNA-binding SARP family transcriptional activator